MTTPPSPATRRPSWPKTIGGALLGGVLVAVVVLIWQHLSVPVTDGGWHGHDDRGHYTRVGYERLGREIAERHPGKTVILIHVDYSVQLQIDQPTQNTLIIDHIRNGLDGRNPLKLVNLVPADYQPSEDYMKNAQWEVPTNAKLEAILAEHVPGYADPAGDADPTQYVVLSLIGLPNDTELAPYFAKPAAERPILVVANATLDGHIPQLQSGAIDISLSYNPHATYNPNWRPPENDAAAFDERWVLITPENVDAIAAKYPELFGLDSSE